MKVGRYKNGIAVIAIVIVILVVAVAGAAGYLVYSRQSDDSSSNNTQGTEQLSRAEVKQLEDDCNKKYNDEDLCKFLSSWTAQERYQIESSASGEGQTYSLSLKTDGENNYMKTSGTGYDYEVYTIGTTTYTLDKSDGVWWKSTSEPSSDSSTVTSDLEIDASEDITNAEDTTVYTSLGKEACGDDMCFKYEVSDSASPSSKQYIWFDDKDYQLRRMQVIDGASTYDATYAYEDIEISAPSPTKDVPAGSFVGPDGTLITLPTADEVIDTGGAAGTFEEGTDQGGEESISE